MRTRPAACLLTIALCACLDEGESPLAPGLQPQLASPLAVTAPDTKLVISGVRVETDDQDGRFETGAGLSSGALAYVDRNFRYADIPPALSGQPYIRTAQAYRATQRTLSFTIDRTAVVYVAHDDRQPPGWLREGFTPGGEIRILDGAGALKQIMHLFSRSFPAGKVVLGRNREADSRANMYTVFLVPALEPAATLDQGGDFVALSGGFRHTCALTADGAAYCWGYGGDGQLGDGTRTTRLRPARVSGDVRFTSLSAGAYHSCGLTAEGAAYCWGSNRFGQLGNGTTTGLLKPVRVSSSVPFVSVHAGGQATCALSNSGVAYCWGRNDQGQLGSGMSASSIATRPVRVYGSRTFTSLTAGWKHACGVTVSNVAFCWGKNKHGQLGNGTTSRSHRPTRVAGTLLFSSISATGAGTGVSGSGQNHTCALTTTGRAYCWGDNWHNPLGLNDTRGNRTRPQAVRGVPALADLVTGGDHSCGVSADAELWCWGDNLRGQLGYPNGSDYNAARSVSDTLPFFRVALGWDHSCAIAMDGFTYCWGWNGDGQVGDGTRQNRSQPVMVRPL